MKKLTLSLAALSATAAPIATVVACGSSTSSDDTDALVKEQAVFKALGATDEDLGNEIIATESKEYQNDNSENITLTKVITTTFKNSVTPTLGETDILPNEEVGFGKSNGDYYVIMTIQNPEDDSQVVTFVSRLVDTNIDEAKIIAALQDYYGEIVDTITDSGDDEISPPTELSKSIAIKSQDNEGAVYSVRLDTLALPVGVDRDYIFYSETPLEIGDTFVYDTYNQASAFAKEITLTLKSATEFKVSIINADGTRESHEDVSYTKSVADSDNFVLEDTRGSWVAYPSDFLTGVALVPRNNAFVEYLNRNQALGKIPSLNKTTIDALLPNGLTSVVTLDTTNGTITSIELS